MHYRDPISGLRREIDQMFHDAFSGEGGRAGSGTSGGGGGGGATGRAVRGWTPAVEIREDEDELIFEFDLPGVRPDDVEVTSDRGVLVVRGHREAQRSEGPGRIHVTERAYGEFGRFFQLPQTVDEERIEASFDDGVLTVRVPKAEIARPRKIEIRSAGAGSADKNRGGSAGQSGEVRGGSGRSGALGASAPGRAGSGSASAAGSSAAGASGSGGGQRRSVGGGSGSAAAGARDGSEDDAR